MANFNTDLYEYPVLIDARDSQTQSLQIFICRSISDFSLLRMREEKGGVNIIKAPLTSKDRLVYAKTRDGYVKLSPSNWKKETYLAESVAAKKVEKDTAYSLVDFILEDGTDLKEYVLQDMDNPLMTDIDHMLPLQPYVCRKNGKVVGELTRINRSTNFWQIIRCTGDRQLHTSTLRSLDKLISDGEDAYVFNSIQDYNVSKILHHDNVYMEIEK